MKLAKYQLSSGLAGVARVEGDQLLPLDLSGGQYQSLAEILEADNPLEAVEFLTRDERVPLAEVSLLPPIDRQEVWAAGVTYKRSKAARMEESATSASCYDRVYVSPRPELFFKASPHRVAGHGQPLRIRKDSQWNVPEPELTLVLSSKLAAGRIYGGQRHELARHRGRQPALSAAGQVLQPVVRPRAVDHAAGRHGAAQRDRHSPGDPPGGQEIYDGRTSVDHMARTFEDLIGWLGRDNSFPTGVFLLTGTGIVPEGNFTLAPADIVEIKIDGIGTLLNPVVQG